MSYFKPFGYKYFVLNNGKEDLGKFNPRVIKGCLLATHIPTKLTGSTTKRHNVWKRVFMLYLMKLEISVSATHPMMMG